MAHHLYRLVVSFLLACILSLLGGCVVTKFSAGFSLAPPSLYLNVEQYLDNAGTPATPTAPSTTTPAP